MAGNKLSRVDHCLIFIDDSTLEFECMDNVVHVDEKWFYEDKDKRSYLLFSGEEPPHTRRVKASGSSPRPCSWQPSLDHDMTLIDSALGRKARAVAIDGGVCSAAVVIDRRRPIMIQQDNAKPHVLPHDSDVVAAGMEEPCPHSRYRQPHHYLQAAYKNMSADTLDNIFLTLQTVCDASYGRKHLYDSAKAVLAESDRGSLAFFEPAE
ncbi:hypothetical protein PC122_g4026 [Phytophthora cactorum]|nr:hypothetical protein PC122_g4026 [Phytophthora cactorum]